MDELSVTYQHGTLQTDISNLQTSEVETLEINWSDTSSQEEFTRCEEEISRFLESYKFPEVKRLVLNNLFYSEKLVENLLEKFPNIGHLKILPFNYSCRYDDFYIDFLKLRALRELEMTLGFSNAISLFPPDQLKELTLSISKMASNRIESAEFQRIYLGKCTSLEYL